MENSISSIIIAIVSAVITTYLSILIQFSKNKADAIGSIKLFLLKTFKIVWLLWLLYNIAIFAISSEPASRYEITSVIILVACIIGVVVSELLGDMYRQLKNVHKLNDDILKNNEKVLNVAEKLNERQTKINEQHIEILQAHKKILKVNRKLQNFTDQQEVEEENR